MSARTFDLPDAPFEAVAGVPGDKSLGHRALILSALASGRSRVTGLSAGADVGATAAAIQALGVTIDNDEITSPGIGSWSTPSAALDCGNSGTTMRLLAGALAGSRVTARLIGDDSLRRRPMARVVDPLRQMGADIAADDGTAPLHIVGSHLCAIDLTLSVASAQVRSSIALAALNAVGETTISSPSGFRDHTERWLTHLELAVRPDPDTLIVSPGAVPAIDVAVPGDPSSAAFLWAAAAVRSGSTVTTTNVSLNPGRIGFLEVLEAMGASVEVTTTGEILGDPIGDVMVTGTHLEGITISGSQTVAALDELPLVAVVAAAAEGTTSVQDAEELRVKESDRIAGGVALAQLAGAVAQPTDDGFVVGVGSANEDTALDAHGDHRIAMAGAVAALVRRAPVSIEGFAAAGVSWPGFDRVLEGLWS